MKKKIIFAVSLIIYAFILVIGASMLLTKVKEQLAEYEASQPEKAVEVEINAIVNAAKNGSITSIMSLPDDFVGEFDVESPFVKPYLEIIANGGLTYKQVLGDSDASDGNAKTYALFSGDRQLAKLKMRGVNERTRLLIFTCYDWELVSLEAVGSNNLSLKFPKGITATVDGVQMAGKEGDDGMVTYTASSLDTFGSIVVSDEYGHTIEVDVNNADKIKYKSFVINVPNSFKVAIGENILAPDADSAIEMSGFDNVKPYYSGIPSMVSYNFSILVEEGKDPDVSVTDNVGNAVSIDYENGYLEVNDLTKLDALPESIANEFDVLKCVETQSLFTTDDLSGKKHGFATLAEYLIKDSYLYNSFYEFATGVDITFTSNHKLLDPAFVDESVGGFISYGDNCFSCEVKLTKRMKLTRTGEIKLDTIDATYFFVKYDTTDSGVDDPQWYMVDFRSNLSVGQ